MIGYSLYICTGMLVKNFGCEKIRLRKISVTINFSYEKFRRKLGRNFSSTKFFVRKVPNSGSVNNIWHGQRKGVLEFAPHLLVPLLTQLLLPTSEYLQDTDNNKVNCINYNRFRVETTHYMIALLRNICRMVVSKFVFHY